MMRTRAPDPLDKGPEEIEIFTHPPQRRPFLRPDPLGAGGSTCSPGSWHRSHRITIRSRPTRTSTPIDLAGVGGSHHSQIPS